MFVVGDAEFLAHAPQHLKAAGDVHIALGQGIAHHPLVGLMALLAAESGQNAGQHVHLIGVEIVEAAALQEATDIKPQLLQLAAEALGQILAAIEGRTAVPVAHQPQGAGGDQRHVEQVLHPGRRQLQQWSAGEQEEEVEHQKGGRQKDAVADQDAIGFRPSAAHAALHPDLDRPAGQPAQPAEQSEQQRHYHQPRDVDGLAKQEQPGAEQGCQLIRLAGPGAGEVVVPVAGIEVVVEEIAHHQADIGIALEGKGGLLQPCPVHALGIDVDAGLLAGHAGALLLAVGINRAAHRLGDRGRAHRGGAAQQ